MDIGSVDLQRELGALLEQYGQEVASIMNEEAEAVAKEAKKRLAKESKQFNGTGKYASGWKIKKEKLLGGTSVFFTIYNAKRGSLVHLLEKGHPIVSNGRRVGSASAFPHVRTVNDWIASELPKRIRNKLNK